MTTNQHAIGFLCTGNSARSLIAEAIANHEFADQFHACSAGSQPAAEPHPLTLETLSNNGVSTEGLRPKGVEELTGQHVDLLITLCDDARGACESFIGVPAVHWKLPDPPAAEDPKAMFATVYEALVEALGLLAHAPDPDLAGRAAEAGRQLSRRLAPRAI